VVEAKRFNDCVRGSWPAIMQTFPELGLWRDLRDSIQNRVWDTSNEPEPIEKLKSRSPSRSRSRSRRRRSREKEQNRSDNPVSAAEKQRDVVWESRWTTSDDRDNDSGLHDRGQQQTEKRDRRRIIEYHPKMDCRACCWGRKWRAAIMALLPSGVDSAAPLIDQDARRLAYVLWKDVSKWAAVGHLERSLSLFRADHQTSKTFGWDGREAASVSRGLEPGSPPQEWAFIPVADLLLVVGEGIIGITTEGMFSEAQPGHKRLEFAQCFKTKAQRERKERREQKENEKASQKQANGEVKAKSKWDVQA